jgi:hypothetical protein
MHHKATIKLGTHDNLPYNIQCSCGTGGDFGSEQEAINWMNQNHFRYLQGVNTAEFVFGFPKAGAAPPPTVEAPAETEEPAQEAEEEVGDEEEKESEEEPEKGKVKRKRRNK